MRNVNLHLGILLLLVALVVPLLRPQVAHRAATSVVLPKAEGSPTEHMDWKAGVTVGGLRPGMRVEKRILGGRVFAARGLCGMAAWDRYRNANGCETVTYAMKDGSAGDIQQAEGLTIEQEGRILLRAGDDVETVQNLLGHPDEIAGPRWKYTLMSRRTIISVIVDPSTHRAKRFSLSLLEREGFCLDI